MLLQHLKISGSILQVPSRTARLSPIFFYYPWTRICLFSSIFTFSPCLNRSATIRMMAVCNCGPPTRSNSMPSPSAIMTTLATSYAMSSSIPESSSSKRPCRRPRPSASESSFPCSPTGVTATGRSVTRSSTATSSSEASYTYDPPAYSTSRPSSGSSPPDHSTSTSSSEPSHTYDPAYTTSRPSSASSSPEPASSGPSHTYDLPAYSTSRPSSDSSPPDHSASPHNEKSCPSVALIVGSTLAALVLAVILLLLCFLCLRKRRRRQNCIRLLDPPAPFDLLSSYSSEFSVTRIEPYIITLPNDANASASRIDSKDLLRSPIMDDGKQAAPLLNSISLPALHPNAAEVHRVEYINERLSQRPSSTVMPGSRTRFPDSGQPNETWQQIPKLESAWWTRFSNVPPPAGAHLK
ncbi:hypothetical protein R3P38DRAFT_1112655 [Favolaschia claudopus]|uniref:Uncharacterized protein n=1 Tax=Favolaschia claudopus TaxID=2862362 RepID=A0AAW0B8B7_9AGAR